MFSFWCLYWIVKSTKKGASTETKSSSRQLIRLNRQIFLAYLQWYNRKKINIANIVRSNKEIHLNLIWFIFCWLQLLWQLLMECLTWMRSLILSLLYSAFNMNLQYTQFMQQAFAFTHLKSLFSAVMNSFHLLEFINSTI